MSTTPTNLKNLRTYLIEKTGLPAVSLGIVGNTAHTKGYHLGKDRIFGSNGIGDRDYSVKTWRDKIGLTNAASAMDISNFTRLRAMSVWLVKECRLSALDTLDIREVIYSPDGISVLRWDRERGVQSLPQLGEADSSHRTHTHISWYRNSTTFDQTTVFRRFFDPVSIPVAAPQEVDMQITAQVNERWHPSVTNGVSNGVLRASPDRSAPIVKRILEVEAITTVAEIRTISGNDGNWRLVKTHDRSVLYMLRSDWVSEGIL